MANQLIVGAGKFGKRFYHYLKSLEFSPISLSRTDKAWSDQHLKIDLSNKDFQLPILPKLDQVFIVLAPSERTSDAYRQVYIEAISNLLAQLKIQQENFHCVFLSATSVYGANQLGMVDEAVAPEPDNFRGEILLEAEENIKALHKNSSIVRASGLYSEDRQRLIDSLTTKENLSNLKWMNLIHEDDLCQWLAATARNRWPIAIASDGHAFQRRHLNTSSAIHSDDSFRQFKSQYLHQISLKYPSFINWWNCQ